MNVAIVNYGMGNIASVQNAVASLGHTPVLAQEPAALHQADRIILPGVGAFAEGMARLEAQGWSGAIKQLASSGRPLLGICLGMQFLADRGTEGGPHGGLGLIPGTVVSLRELGCDERVPHVGWNETRRLRDDSFFTNLPESADYYYVHSYGFRAEHPGDVLATVAYGCELTAVVRRGRVWGTQFHPEKSSKAGLQLLRNFIELGEC
jgi:glutamine amidotransferase